MSVINQMLKELDQRKPAHQSGPEMVMPVSKYIAVKKNTGLNIVVITALVLVIAVASIFVYRLISVNAVQPEAETIAATVTEQSSQQIAINEESTAIVLDVPEVAEVAEVAEATMSDAEDSLQPVQELPMVETLSEKEVPQRFVKSKPQLDVKTQIEQLYQSARREMDASRPSAAQQLLTKALQLTPDFHKARILLLSILLQQNAVATMDQQLAESLQKWPKVHEYRQMQARLLLQKGLQEEALQILQQTIPPVKSAQDYHALLAYVAQQLHNDQLAIKHYQLLLQQQPGRADWWLGLAVSEERSANKEVALQAYQQSVGRPGLSQSVRQYARQRIKILQGF